MNGFKSRLESVPGVESIELELGDEGLEAITVRLPTTPTSSRSSKVSAACSSPTAPARPGCWPPPPV